MKTFAALYRELDAAASSDAGIAALAAYFAAARDDPARWGEAAWVVHLAAGGRVAPVIPARLLRRLAGEATGLPEWLIEESQRNVGDPAETLALLLPPPTAPEAVSLETWMEERLPALRELDEEARYERFAACAAALPDADRLAVFKLASGGLRLGVTKSQLAQALAQAGGLDAPTVAQRLAGFAPAAADFARLVAPAAAADDGRPYPFFLAHPLDIADGELAARLGPVEGWIVEWKFDGLRAQLLRRGEAWRLWSRDDDLLCEAFPEIGALAAALPDGVALDGALVVE
ncbi:MAG: ATP-dependent DNA ligase, partial [Pseudomonadota bacterium]|nr:ATP-dependent DNA ligase [Pseudomonadota bacterium]